MLCGPWSQDGRLAVLMSPYCCMQHTQLGYVPQTIYMLVMEILWTSSHFNHDSNQVIRSQFCSCHDSSAVVAWAKLWPDWIIILHNRATYILQNMDYGLINHLWNGPQVINIIRQPLWIQACLLYTGRSLYGKPEWANKAIIEQTACLTRLPLVTNICVSESGRHRFR